MATKLKGLKLNELSLVDSPANKSSTVTIFKRKEDEDMSDITKKDHDEAIAKLKADAQEVIDELTYNLSVEKAKAKMCDDDKEYMEGLDESDKKKFLAKSADDRKAEITKFKSSDEAVTVSGVTIKKSAVGVATFGILKAQAKQIEDNAVEIAKANEAREIAEIEKRVDAEFKNVVGTTVLKAKLLRHIAKADKDVQDAFAAIMKSTEALVLKAFDSVGVGNGKSESVQKGERVFLAKVSEIQSRDKVTKHVAMTKAREEFPDEFAEYQNAGSK
jgi:hypothetical protein